MGRPSDFSQDLADRICSELADGKSLRTVCKADDMPCKTTVFMWLRTRPEFLNQYTRAKEESADALTDEMLDIADDGTNDWIESESGVSANQEHIQRSRLRIETRKWIASKLKPKKYGDKLTHEGNPDAPIQAVHRIELVNLDSGPDSATPET